MPQKNSHSLSGVSTWFWLSVMTNGCSYSKMVTRSNGGKVFELSLNSSKGKEVGEKARGPAIGGGPKMNTIAWQAHQLFEKCYKLLGIQAHWKGYLRGCVIFAARQPNACQSVSFPTINANHRGTNGAQKSHHWDSCVCNRGNQNHDLLWWMVALQCS